MQNHIHHRGYTGDVVFSAEDNCLVGHVLGVASSIGYHGDSVPEIQLAFRDAVDSYLAACEADGHAPETPDLSQPQPA